MGRDIGTNVYSNNFEPQVMGLLDARTRVDTKADLTKTATWTSADGNTYVPVGIRVSVTDDTTNGNNGVYMLMGEEYTIASNWMQINSSSGGGSTELVMVDLSTVNTIPGTYTPDRYLMGEFIKIQDALSIDTPFFVYQFNAEFGQFQTSAIADGSISLQLSILYRDEIWLINFDGGNYTVAKADMGGSSVSSNVKVLTTPQLLDTTRTTGSIELSAADVAVLKGLSVGKDMVAYSGTFGIASQFIPLSVNMVKNGNARIFIVSFVFANSLYYFNINGSVTLNKFTAEAINRAEGSGGGKTEKISIPFATIRDLAENANTTSSDIVATIGQDNLDKLCNFYLPLDIEMPGLYGDGPMYARKNYMMGIPNNLAVYINTLENKMFVLHKINDEYKLNVFPQIIFDSTIEPSSTNAPQNKAVYNALKTKQDTLVSGKNIKTINGQSILGSGNLQIAGGSGSAEVLKVSLYDLGYTNGTYTISKGDYSYDSIVELDNNRSSGKVIYAYEIYGVMGMFNISIDDYNNIFYVDFLDKKLKVEYNINRDDTITCDVTDVTKHDLSLDVRISNNKIQYRIHEVVPNGYICFYRKKRCRNSKTDRPHVNKYTIPDFYFSSKIRTLGFPAIKKKYMIPASKVQVNTWTDFPMDVLNVFSTNSATLVSFTGTVHANPCHKDTTTNNWNKYLAVLNMGLAYNVVNTNFINGIKENNAYPTDIIQSGDMVKFKCRLMAPYELRYTMY